MSIALDRNSRIPPSVFSQGGLPSYCSVLNTAGIIPVVRREAAVGDAVAPAEELDRCSSSSSSSIGENSGLSVKSSDNDDDGENNEAESSYKGPLGMESLEEVLPMRRGISNFYNGKSKSFTSLAEASSAATIKDIAKPENAYSRKRRNLLASNLIAGGISKRPISSSRSSLALAVAMYTSGSHSSDDLNSRSPPPIRPPLHPNGRSSRSNLASTVHLLCKYPTWRSYSLADIQ
ncbi:uncharacterized protein LOC111004861 [Momordica charantia]|uniref:Uncharacterized protein LOC111004861 n=1 Tax=Momordica charantia TaxID=3673 RepID=A0A6J1BS00_MOMCH|nr:uncharacterized protein LOC111004861 [Momordica charantia]